MSGWAPPFRHRCPAWLPSCPACPVCASTSHISIVPILQKRGSPYRTFARYPPAADNTSQGHRMRTINRPGVFRLLAALAIGGGGLASASAQDVPVTFTAEQAERGQAAYR